MLRHEVARPRGAAQCVTVGAWGRRPTGRCRHRKPEMRVRSSPTPRTGPSSNGRTRGWQSRNAGPIPAGSTASERRPEVGHESGGLALAGSTPAAQTMGSCRRLRFSLAPRTTGGGTRRVHQRRHSSKEEHFLGTEAGSVRFRVAALTAGMAEWLGSGLPNRIREFDSRCPLYAGEAARCGATLPTWIRPVRFRSPAPGSQDL